jgi:hypothetical protein
MANQTPVAPGIARSERGLVVAGTRLTLYAIMDFIKANWPSDEIRDWFGLTEQQWNDVRAYLAANEVTFEAEYQEVLREAAEIERYHRERTRDLLARIAALPPKPEQAAARAKLAEMRARRQAHDHDPA